MTNNIKNIDNGHLCANICLNVMLPIGAGALIYGLFRGLYFIDAEGAFFPVYDSVKIPSWILYNLPDGLWLYALLFTLTFIWRRQYTTYFIYWAASAVACSFLSECLQAIHFLPGTFDWKDMLAYALAVIGYLFQFKNLYKKQSLILKFKEDEN